MYLRLNSYGNDRSSRSFSAALVLVLVLVASPTALLEKVRVSRISVLNALLAPSKQISTYSIPSRII